MRILPMSPGHANSSWKTVVMYSLTRLWLFSVKYVGDYFMNA